MIPTTERHAIIWKLLSIGARTLLVFACLSTVQPGRAEAQSSAQPAQIKTGGSEITVDLKADEQLEPGKSVERELAVGEIHSYRVILTAGQFLRVVVSTKEDGTFVTLLGPDGKQVIEIFSHNSKQGMMIRAVAEAAGDYRLQLRPRNERTPAGKYAVKIEELRVATLQDRKQFAADLAFTVARQLEEKGTEEASKDALKNTMNHCLWCERQAITKEKPTPLTVSVSFTKDWAIIIKRLSITTGP